MVREYLTGTPITLETKLGPFAVTVVDYSTLYIEAGRDRGNGFTPIMVNGVALKGYTRMERTPGQSFDFARFPGGSIDQRNVNFNRVAPPWDEASASAGHKITDVLMFAVNAWAVDPVGKAAIREGGARDLSNQVSRAEDKYQEALDALDVAREAMGKARDAERTFKGES